MASEEYAMLCARHTMDDTKVMQHLSATQVVPGGMVANGGTVEDDVQLNRIVQSDPRMLCDMLRIADADNNECACFILSTMIAVYATKASPQNLKAMVGACSVDVNGDKEDSTDRWQLSRQFGDPDEAATVAPPVDSSSALAFLA
jgi:hypothetical protein